MRFAILFIVLVGLISCGKHSSCPKDGEPEPWTPVEGEMNLAVLLVDYQTYAFHGGNIARYELGDTCAEQGLPFEAHHRAPADFGSMTFTYTATGDTLFDATIIWMGRGRISHPSAFVDPDSFAVETTGEALPSEVIYFRGDGRPVSPNADVRERTGRAWAAVSDLEIVHAYAEKPYRVGFYLYPPTVGAFDPFVAKWVVFLYWCDEGA